MKGFGILFGKIYSGFGRYADHCLRLIIDAFQNFDDVPIDSQVMAISWIISRPLN